MICFYGRLVLVAFALLVSGRPSWAEDPEPTSLLRILNRPPTAGVLKSLTAENAEFLVDGKELKLPLTEISRFGDWQETARGPQIVLHDGSILSGDILRMTTEELVLGDALQLGRCRWEDETIPLSRVRGILLQPPGNRLERDRLLLALANEKRRDDELLVVGGEMIQGICLGTKDAEGTDSTNGRSWQTLRFQVRGVNRAVNLPAAKVRGLAFTTTLQPPLKTAPAYWLGLADGNLLAVRKLHATSKSVELQLAGGVLLNCDLETGDEHRPRFFDLVTFLWPSNPRMLAVRPPVKYEFRPYLATEWPLGIDTNVHRGRLRQRTGVALHGFGCHAGGTIELEVPERAEFFEVEACVDDSLAENGRMQFAILAVHAGPAKEVAVSPVLTPRDKPYAFRIPVTAGAKLRLEARWADGGDVGDDGNWCYPRFVLGGS